MAIDIVPKIKELRVNKDLVKSLEQMLERAKDGRITGMSAVCLNSDETITTVIDVSGNRFSISHGISALWYRYQKMMHDDAYQAFDSEES